MKLPDTSVISAVISVRPDANRRISRAPARGHPHDHASSGLAWRFWLDRAGSTAIEFALVLPVYAMLVFGLVEVSLIQFASAALEGASNSAARQIRTGSVQLSGSPMNEFQRIFCEEVFAFVACDGDVVFNVQTFGSFQEVTMQPLRNPDGTLKKTNFVPGGPGEIMIVQSAYQWDILTPMLGLMLGDNGGSTRLIASTAVFRNEPFGASP